MSDDLVTAQKALGKTLDKAGIADDKEIAQYIRDQGQRFAKILNGLFRMTRTHALNNAAYDPPVTEIVKVIAGLYDAIGPIHLICVEDQVYVNDIRIRFESHLEHSIALGRDLRLHNTGGITFNETLEDPEIRILIKWLASEAAEENPRTTLHQNLVSDGVISVQLHPGYRFKISGEKAREYTQDFTDVCNSSANVVADVFGDLGANRLPNPLPVRRTVNELVDISKGADAARLATEADESLPNFSRHVMMVTNLSVLIARNAGLSDATCGDVGVAAMFHDAGFTMKENGYAVSYERHTRAGLRILLRQRGFHESKIRRILTIIQHHRDYTDKRGVPSLYARIVHIADDYDILTRIRPGTGPVLAPPDAMARMGSGSGSSYDPVLLQIFVNAMGPFPPGSMLRLADGSLVVTASAVRDESSFDKPLARLIRDANGDIAPPDTILDLMEAPEIAKIIRPTA
jgi:HD-GYP domain-containing protein (c-di-GMP phosphodiesterase class II)